jgi:hypothetical protein
MVFFQPPAAGGVVASSSGRGVLKADPMGRGQPSWTVHTHLNEEAYLEPLG